MSERILAIIKAGLKGHKSKMLSLMKKYVDDNSSDVYTWEFQKLLGVSDDFKFLARGFNKRHKGFAEIDLYHQTLFIQGEVQPNYYLPQYDSVKSFVDACEKEVQRWEDG